MTSANAINKMIPIGFSYRFFLISMWKFVKYQINPLESLPLVLLEGVWIVIYLSKFFDSAYIFG